jgi:hypothetical protein
MRASWANAVLLLTVPLVTAFVSVGCDEIAGLHSCTDVGCASSAVVDVQRRGFWADGEYSLDVTVDGRQHRCRFELGPAGDGLASSGADCTPSLSSEPFGEGVTIVPEGLPVADDACPSATDGGRPPPCARRRYRLNISLDPSAQQVALRLAWGETLLLERTNALEYVEAQPNGPDCSPTCRQSLLQLEVPEP